MEGNPLFNEAHRYPSDFEIGAAQAKDDTTGLDLQKDIDRLFEDIKVLSEGGEVPVDTVVDIGQYRLQPLMVRASELGELPAAKQQLEALRLVGEGLLQSLTIDDASKSSIRDMWNEVTNTFCAQAISETEPCLANQLVPALLCESTEDVSTTLSVFARKHPNMLKQMTENAERICEIAEMQNFSIPDAPRKLALFYNSKSSRNKNS